MILTLIIIALEKQTQQIQKARDGISGRFKPPVDDGVKIDTDIADTVYPEGQSPQDAMEYPYQLCGVATRRDVVYLLHPDIASDVPGAKQWWRMQYDTESANPVIMRDRLTLQEVLERATSESASALLVYANDTAMSSEPTPLSKPLEDFVKKDNLNFMEELQKNSTGWEDYADDDADVARGGWDNDPPAYENWNDMSAKAFHKHSRNDSNMSSATLTPNTEIDDEGPVMQEMVEVNGGIDAMTGLSDTNNDNGFDISASTSQADAKLIDIDDDDTQTDSLKTLHDDVGGKTGG